MIAICLATYNGDNYLADQLESIINQSFKDWHLYIRDDGSNDNTLEILYNYYRLYQNKITIINDNKGNLGYALNFVEISNYVKENYIAFSDQDDIWDISKLEKLYSSISKYGNTYPVLVYSDFYYLKDNEIIPHEKEIYKRNHNNKEVIKVLFHLGSLLGCTAMVNRKLLEYLKIYEYNISVGHDVFLLAVSSITGKQIYLNEKLIKHRLHIQNTSVVGSKLNVLHLFKKQFNRKNLPSLSVHIHIAKLLNTEFENNIEIKELSNLLNKNIIRRLLFGFNHGLLNFSLSGLSVLIKLIIRK